MYKLSPCHRSGTLVNTKRDCYSLLFLVSRDVAVGVVTITGIIQSIGQTKRILTSNGTSLKFEANQFSPFPENLVLGERKQTTRIYECTLARYFRSTAFSFRHLLDSNSITKFLSIGLNVLWNGLRHICDAIDCSPHGEDRVRSFLVDVTKLDSFCRCLLSQNIRPDGGGCSILFSLQSCLWTLLLFHRPTNLPIS